MLTNKTDANMETEVKVFHSEISRVDCEEDNQLYDLLHIEPAKPVTQHPPSTKKENWEFQPNYAKHYLPKRLPSKLKVKTVSDVRALFENDEYCYLERDLELQQNFLLRKICDGSSSEEKTRKIAIELYNGDKPISRTSWQMLSNINPERHNHSKQFVLWNGKCIQVNGSKGGKNRFIFKYDLKNKVKTSLKSISKFKNIVLKSRKGLLRNSLTVKFRPGPLGKKKFLDTSHHKYQMGNIEVIKLPAPALEISPAYGTVLEPTIASFVKDLRGEKGVITKKLAEFAVSVLGTVHNNTVEQINESSCITFDLNYKCAQNRVLMRRNYDETTLHKNNKNDSNSDKKIITEASQNSHAIGINVDSDVNFRDPLKENITVPDNCDLNFESRKIMDEMLDSVTINVNQESMFSKDDELKDTIEDDEKGLIASKDKSKRKYCELDKLDVTIIKLPEASQKDFTKPCTKSFCTMGCVCESLDCVFSLKQHCGVLECMFGCKCGVSKYKNIELLEQDDIPGLLNLDNEINSHLAKEEQKFHQTVIFSGEKSIVLQSRKRNWKSSKRYSEFYSKMNLKGDEKNKRILSLDVEKLNCDNIEPLCMVHKLYKCFCKGKFIETYVRNNTAVTTNKSLNNEYTKVQQDINANKSLDIKCTDPDSSARNLLRPRIRKTCGNDKSDDFLKYSSNDDEPELSVACARTVGYHGRKYTDSYYFSTNRKIIEMEQNDSLLKKKMLRLINGNNTPSTSETNNNSSESFDCETIGNEYVEDNCDTNKIVKRTEENDKDITNKTVYKKGELNYPFANAEGKGSLKNWLETSYKSYKERLGKGVVRNCLEAPKKGKAALQSWDFILSRYRDRKNIFVVSKQEPYRTFLAVDDKHPLFANCINIDDIRFADLPKYPIIIRNLVTNSTDSENVFCILRGWDHCWELIGSAVKVFEQPSGSLTEDVDFFDTGNLMTNTIDQACEPVTFQEAQECNEIEQNTPIEKSKWFVLTVENDFTEIQFYKKGFYVTYEGIKRSINLARLSGKTVRLSARARTDKTQNTSHQYGIYAIPSNKQCCVFIGPYEEREPLGIEVVKSVIGTGRPNKTRGVWINTNKVDDKNVIDNPLAYLPSASIPSENIPMQVMANTGITTAAEQGENSNKTTPEKEISMSKQIKPIKIRRTNGFYHLSSNNILQKISKPDLFINKGRVSLLKTVDNSEESTTACSSKSILKSVKIATKRNRTTEHVASTSPVTYIKPVAEIAPQIKITHVYSERSSQNMVDISKKDNGSAMHILKPDEINKRILNPTLNDDMSTDIEEFLETSTICIAPQDEVLVISDGEDDSAACFTDVWIECCNVENFGYIRAKINDDNLISFELPGFKYSEFYKESDAFDKINQVLARKMYIPKKVKLLWEVVWEKQHLTCDMLTPNCLKDKKYLMTRLREQRAKHSNIVKAFKTSPKINTTEAPKTKKVVTYFNKKTSSKKNAVVSNETAKAKNEQMKLIEGLEETSKKLEQQSAVLWKEAVTRRNEIFGSLSMPDNLKTEMAEALQDIMSLNEQ